MAEPRILVVANRPSAASGSRIGPRLIARGPCEFTSVVPVMPDAADVAAIAGSELGVFGLSTPTNRLASTPSVVISARAFRRWPNWSIERITNLAACPGVTADRAQLTVHPGLFHEGWDQAYSGSDGDDIYKWMLGFSKP